MNEGKSNSSNTKKLFYKKWWFYLIVAIVLVVAITGFNEPSTIPTEKQETSQTNEMKENSTIQGDTNEVKTNSDVEQEMIQLAPDGYTGPECWLLNGNGVTSDGETLDVYANIDNKSDDWHNDCKTVFKMLISEYSKYNNLTFKIYNSKENMSNNQPTYNNLIALWQSNPVTYVTESKPTITWYPNGAGVNSKQESEIWNP